MAVTRFGVSLESDLLEALDVFVQANNFPNRSQAIRHLIEKNLVESKWKCNNVVAGTIILISEASKLDVRNKMAEIQNQHSALILSSQRFYLSAEKIMEIITVKGTANDLSNLSDKLIGIKGVEHGKLSMSKAE
jgi:CopG family transcriptional regulator, nickel-responsive regulator